MTSPLRRRFRHARRVLGYGFLVLLILLATGVGALNQLLPLVERHPDKVANWLSERLGEPVAFESARGEWTRKGPRFTLGGLRIGEGERQLEVGHAELLDGDRPMAFVVSKMGLHFLRPARIDDQLVVRTHYDAVKGPRLLTAGLPLFPHGGLPLHLFEPRYREMLADTLSGSCFFAGDTGYGPHFESELAVGRAIQGRRDKVCLATKCGIHRIAGESPSVYRDRLHRPEKK